MYGLACVRACAIRRFRLSPGRYETPDIVGIADCVDGRAGAGRGADRRTSRQFDLPAGAEARLDGLRVDGAAAPFSRETGSGARFFHPRHAADGDPKTAWSPGQRGLNLGTLIELRFTAVRRIRYLALWNGDGRSPKAWAGNGRLRQALIQTSDGLTDRVDLVARNGMQLIVLSRPADTRWIRLIATAATPGQRHRPFAISEFRPSDGERSPDVPVVGAAMVDDWLPEPPD